MFFSDEEIKNISKKLTAELMEKRGSAYCVENIAKKLNISIEEAAKISDDRKNKTSGTLENFIKRHGEEAGREKFEEFKNKSSHTKEKYLDKYGACGEEIWESYIRSKGKGISDYIEEFGEEDGKKKWEDMKASKAIGSSKAGIIKNHGEEYYETMSKNRKEKLTEDFYIKKHGEEKGRKMWSEICQKKDVASYSYFIKKFNGDEDLAKEEYDKSRLRCSSIYIELRKIYGEDKAIEIYKSKDNENIKVKKDIKSNRNKNPHLRSKKGCVSSIANNFFKEIEAKIGRKFLYGRKRDELKLFDEENGRIYHYDCVDNKTMTIIEFNGETFHSKGSDDANIYGINTFEKDKRKIAFGELSGYKVLVVWDSQIKRKHERLQEIERIVEEIRRRES